MPQINAFIRKHMRTIEMIAVLMRIFAFSLVSWYGPQSQFLFVWIFNTIDAIVLTWCAILRRDPAYTVLNAFWVLIGTVGMYRAASFTH